MLINYLFITLIHDTFDKLSKDVFVGFILALLILHTLEDKGKCQLYGNVIYGKTKSGRNI